MEISYVVMLMPPHNVHEFKGQVIEAAHSQGPIKIYVQKETCIVDTKI